MKYFKANAMTDNTTARQRINACCVRHVALNRTIATEKIFRQIVARRKMRGDKVISFERDKSVE